MKLQSARTSSELFRPVNGRPVRLRSTAFMLALLAAALAVPNGLRGSSLSLDATAPSMKSVNDVLGGQYYLLQDDEVNLLQVYQLNGQTYTTVKTFPTSNSHFEHTYLDTSITLATSPGSAAGVPSSVGFGRMLDTGNDQIAAVFPGSTTPLAWSVTVVDSVAQTSATQTIGSRFAPSGGLYTQLVMGNYGGTGLAQALLFYASTSATGDDQIGMTIVAAEQPNAGSQFTLKIGPELYTHVTTGFAPVTGSIVAGDFNGDGHDEIAALFTDNQTIQFYTVDPATLTITPAASFKLPNPLDGGARLVPGRFRSDHGVELVVVGEVQGSPGPITMYSIQPMQNGQLQPAVDQIFTIQRSGPLRPILAQAAPLKDPYAATANDQLVVAYDNSGTFQVLIGSFDDNFNFSQDTSENEGNSPSDCYDDMKIGNFDNQDSSGNHNPNLQLAFFADGGCGSGSRSTAYIFNLNTTKPSGNWLSQSDSTDFDTGVPGSQMQTISMYTADLLGRSIRLGSPEVMRIPTSIQPDVVLAIPPMHIDYIPTIADVSGIYPNCDKSGLIPCEFNISVMPSYPAPNQGFSSTFSFTSTDTQNHEHQSTTSWGVSVKTTAQTKVSWGDEVSGENLDIKQSAGYMHDNKVSTKYNTYSKSEDSVQVTSGFADHIFFTERDMWVYYYPVLGRTGCPSTNPDCPDSEKLPLYVEFSVPDNVSHQDVDATTQEWYQPAHEPGNILSYPWSKDILQKSFGATPLPLTPDPPDCNELASSSNLFNTTWQGQNSTSVTSATTNAWSQDLSVSAGGRAGTKNVIGVSFSFTVDIGANESLSTLNVDSQSFSESKGISVFQPQINDTSITNCCSYFWGDYIFGVQNSLGTYQGLLQQATINQTGPLVLAFLADPVPNRTAPSGGLSCSGGNPQWWSRVYNQPDVGVVHPARWNWTRGASIAASSASFAKPGSDPLNDSFYQMKGFFITQKGDEGKGPNLSEATVGDQLTLAARIYNFSLVDTTKPVHTAFYGQLYCSSGGAGESSCQNPQGGTCGVSTLCGNSFFIGQTTIPVIPGFKSDGGTAPNWAIASVPFDTTNYGGAYMVFWVVTWMQDENGNLGAEMYAHGLKAVPDLSSLKQITDVPFEAYSNNLGMYGVNTPFYVHGTVEPSATAATGVIKDITLASAHTVLLGTTSKVSASFEDAGGAIESANVAYFDGNPSRNGELLDLQRIPYIAAGSNYNHRIRFTPQSCGTHTLYAEVYGDGLTPTVSRGFPIYVTVDPIERITEMLSELETIKLTAPLRDTLRQQLNAALTAFQLRHPPAGKNALQLYVRNLRTAGEKDISAFNADRLIGQAGAILDCSVAAPPKIVATQMLARDSRNNVVVTLTLTNEGGAPAMSTLVTSAKIGSTPAIAVPSLAVNISAGSSAPVKLVFPPSVGSSGTRTTLGIAGTYTGGSFNFTSRITLP